MPIGGILSSILAGFKDIFASIFTDLSIFWYIGPLLFFWFVLEVYFSEHQDEELGWNTALSNGLSVFWLLIISIKFLFEKHLDNFEWPKFIALILIMAYALLIIYNSFEHKLEARVSFLLASPTLTYYVSGVAILWTYGGLNITLWVLVDLIILYGLALLFELFLRKIVKRKSSGFGPGKPDGFGGLSPGSNGGFDQGLNMGGNL